MKNKKFFFPLIFILCIFVATVLNKSHHSNTIDKPKINIKRREKMDYNQKNEKIYVPLTYIGEYHNPDLTVYKEMGFDMETFIWWTKLSDISDTFGLKIHDNISFKDCDYIASFGNKLSSLFYYNVAYDYTPSGIIYYPYVTFEKEHHPQVLYLYRLDKKYNFYNIGNGNEIFNYNEWNKIPYSESDIEIEDSLVDDYLEEFE